VGVFWFGDSDISGGKEGEHGMKNIAVFFFAGWLAMTLTGRGEDDLEVGEKGFEVGLNGHILTQTGDRDIRWEDQIALLKKANVTIYRFDLSPHPDMDLVDKWVEELRKNQIAPLPILYPPGCKDQKITPAEAEKQAYDYALTFARRFKGRVRYWELANELDDFSITRHGDVMPDGSLYKFGAASGWGAGDFNEKRYQLSLGTLRGLSRGMREGDPSARLIVDSCGWLHVGFFDRLVKDKLDYDIVSWHWYSDFGNIRTAGGRPLLDHIVSYHKPIWITEGGYRPKKNDPDEDKHQADYFQAALADFSDLYPLVQVYCVYTLFDTPTDGKPYGIVTIEKKDNGWIVGKTKPAFDAVSGFSP
jgi:hypothetical protein